ncbi:MAG: PQQ-like beta-propeller repeat protein [Planctomycetaceae bacterium]|nr:PQQ-like beta-propeller repeat protein [Planctomycetaceae bacterium]
MLRSLILILLCLSPVLVSAGDWPQILGPHRNGIADDEAISTQWPKAGPKVLWTAKLGSGFAGPAVRDGKVYQLHRIDDQLILQCYDAMNGDPLWKVTHPCDYVATISYDDGPRCVPTVTEDLVITYGPAGRLQAVDLNTSKRLWLVNTHQKYEATPGYFGAGSSPLVVKDRVIVNVGGRRTNAGMVAFSLKDGSELWKATAEDASYSSPILTQLGDQPVVLAITRLKCVALDPESGKVLFDFPFGKRGPTVNAANPVIIDEKLFLSASYGIGAKFGTLGMTGFQEEWSNDRLLSSQYTTSVLKGDFLYGIHGRQDLGQAELRCLHPENGEVAWSKTLNAYGTLILVNDKLLVTCIDGTLTIVEADPRAYRQLATASIQQATQGGSALPALSNGLFFVRDQETLRCLDLRKSN